MEKINGTLKTIFEEKLQMEIERLKLQYEPSENPKLILVGGQPGAGKTNLERFLNSKNEYVSINGDEYRKFHPQYEEFNRIYGQDASKQTQQWAGEFTARLVEFFKCNKYNCIIEGTFRTSTLPIKEANSFKEYGYTVEVYVMAVNRYLSYISTLKRYEDLVNKHLTPRMTPKAHHDLVVSQVAENLSVMYESEKFDKITIVNRNLEELYNSKDCCWNPKSIMESIVNPKKIKKEEFEQLKDEIKYVEDLLKRRNASEEQIDKLDEFKRVVKELPIEESIEKYNDQGELEPFSFCMNHDENDITMDEMGMEAEYVDYGMEM